jgi:hypothetical protein
MKAGSHAGMQPCRQADMQEAAMLVGSHAGMLQTVMKAYKQSVIHEANTQAARLHILVQTGR